MVKKLIRCLQCNEIIPDLPREEGFGEDSLPGVEWSPVDLDRRAHFFDSHHGHLTQELLVDSETIVGDKPSFDPIGVTYFEASNGKKRFLVRRTRDRLDHPPCYELILGHLQVSNVGIRIQEEELLREISHQNGSFPLTGEKVRKFIQAFREEVEQIPPENYEKELEVFGESSLLAHGTLKKQRWKNVLERCRGGLQNSDLIEIQKFIEDNSEAQDVLSLLIDREISIVAPPERE